MSNLSSKLSKLSVFFSLLVTLGLSLCLFIVLVIYSWDAVSQQGFALWSLSWHPAAGHYGIVPMLYGSMAVTVIALTLAVPVGLLTALYIAEILNEQYRLLIKSVLELLAGIPSILYGLIGVAFVSTWLEHQFNLTSGRTILTAGLLLAIMILPTLITLVEEALHNVPRQYREAARGLGLYRYEVICYCVLPVAWSEVVSVIILATGRALGETMAVMLVIGSIDKIPQPVYNLLMPGQTITSKLGREMEEAAFGSLHFSVLILMSLVLSLTVLLLTLLAYRTLDRTVTRYD